MYNTLDQSVKTHYCYGNYNIDYYLKKVTDLEKNDECYTMGLEAYSPPQNVFFCHLKYNILYFTKQCA